MKLLITDKNKKLLVKYPKKDFHTKYGCIKKAELKKRHTKVKDFKFDIIDAKFIDLYRRIKRKAQLMSLKTIGRIIAETGMDNKSIIVDAGTGSGGITCFLANIVKKVYTFDNNEEHLKIAKENMKFLGIMGSKVCVKKVDVYKNGFKGVKKQEADVAILDLLEPYKCLDHAYKVLKNGGFLVIFCTQITQALGTVNKIKKFNNSNGKGKSKSGNKFIDIKTIESIERTWKLEDKIARPRFTGIGHTGFVVFMRRG